MIMFAFSFSQDKFLKTPDLSDQDLQSAKSAKFPEAAAEILYRSVHFIIETDGTLNQEVVQRVKIYDKNNASDFLDVRVGLYSDGKGSSETLTKLKAYTYNFENGKKTETKVEKDEKYKSKEDKNYTITKFAFPNVKDGSVIEYSYTILTPFLGSTPRVLIENDIPVRYVEFVFDTPKMLGYTINYKGDLNPTNRNVEERMIYGIPYQTYRFAYENVPAYLEEKYVQNNDNYKTGIKAELNSTNFQNKFKSYAVTWKDIQERLYKHDSFGQQLKRQNLADEILPAEIKALPTVKEKANAILKYVQKNFTYNREDDIATDKGIKNLTSTKIGNVAEINLLLTMLLRSAGIEADPVVLSTVKRGFLLAYNPSISQLNYVIASFRDQGQLYLMDGTLKQSEINMIAPKALNYSGILMGKDYIKELSIFYPDVSKTMMNIDAKMNPDGTFEGHFDDRNTKLYAMLNNEIYTQDKETFQKKYKEDYKFPYTNLKQGIQENNDFVSSFDFSGDTFADAIGNKIAFNPLLFLFSQNHDFNQTGPRKAPLEFYSAFDRVKKVTITIPDNYEFQNVPKSKKIRTEDNGIQYTYLVEQEGNKLTVETTVQVDDSVFPKEYYPAFKQIFDNITQLESQVVTAVKK